MSTRSQVLRAIKVHQAQYGWPPTVREIADAIGMRSAANVLRHLRELEKDGFIKRGPFPRQIRLVGEREETQ